MSDQLSSDLASLRIARDESPPRSGWLGRVVIVAVVVGIGIAAYVFGYPYLESKIFKPEVEATQITLVSPAQSSVRLTSSGYVVPQRVSKVGAKIPGRIVAMNVREGDQVEAGDVLAELDDADAQAAIGAARARHLAARARVQTAKAELADIRRKAKRERALADQGVAPKEAADDLEAQLTALQKRVNAEQASAKAAAADVKSVDINLSYLKVVAPMNGTVLNKPAQVGELVGQHVGALVELADFASLVVETDVPEGRLHLVETDGPAEIALDAFPGKRYRGKVVEVSPRINRAKATVTVKVAFVDAVKTVLPDMAARVNFLSEELDPNQMEEPSKLVVPANAIAERGGGKVVFVLEEDTVRVRPISLGEAVGSGFELVEGPPAGTKVVREPSSELGDGQQVKQKGQS